MLVKQWEAWPSSQNAAQHVGDAPPAAPPPLAHPTVSSASLVSGPPPAAHAYRQKQTKYP